MNWGGRECIIIVAQVSWKLLYFTSLLRLHFTKLNKLVTKIKIYVYIYMNEFRLWTKFVRTVRPCSFPRARCHSERSCDQRTIFTHSVLFPVFYLFTNDALRWTRENWRVHRSLCSLHEFFIFGKEEYDPSKHRLIIHQNQQFHDWIIRNWKSALNFLIQPLDLAFKRAANMRAIVDFSNRRIKISHESLV